MKLRTVGLALAVTLVAACSDTAAEPAAINTSAAAAVQTDTTPTAEPLPTGVWRIDSISDATGEVIPPFREETYGTRVIIWTNGEQMAADFCGGVHDAVVLTDRGGRMVGDFEPDADISMAGGCTNQVAFPGATFTAVDETTISVDVLSTTVVLRLTDEACPATLPGDC